LTDFNVALKVTRVTLWQPSFGRKKKAFITERVSCCFRSLAHSNTVHVIQKQQTRAYAARLKSALYGGRSAVMEKISLRHLFETTHVTWKATPKPGNIASIPPSILVCPTRIVSRRLSRYVICSIQGTASDERFWYILLRQKYQAYMWSLFQIERTLLPKRGNHLACWRLS
jgi:hypothetical protein